MSLSHYIINSSCHHVMSLSHHVMSSSHQDLPVTQSVSYRILNEVLIFIKWPSSPDWFGQNLVPENVLESKSWWCHIHHITHQVSTGLYEHGPSKTTPHGVNISPWLSLYTPLWLLGDFQHAQHRTMRHLGGQMNSEEILQTDGVPSLGFKSHLSTTYNWQIYWPYLSGV